MAAQSLGPVTFAPCQEALHSAAILAIFNEAIANSTALYDYQSRTAASMVSWFKAKRDGGFPVVGAFDEAGQLLGFASYGAFRNFPAYKYSVEHSVYVEQSQRGRGLGRQLMGQVIAAAAAQQLHVLIGAIDMSNTASIALHESLGFVHCGTVRQAAFKFGGWLDLGFYQLLLATPEHPVDG